MDIFLPKYGEIMKDAKIVAWLKKEGDPVKKSDPIVVIETEKFTVEVESPTSGFLTSILVREGETVPVGTKLGVVEVTLEKPERKPKDEETRPLPKPELRVSPLARRLAATHRIDLTKIRGTGPDGRIMKEDVEAAITLPSVSETVTRKVEAREIGGMRRTIARRLGESYRETVPVTITMDVDVTDAVRILKTMKDPNITTHPTITDLLIKVAGLGLQQFPILNSSLKGEQIILHEDRNIGVAVAVERGLFVPVVKHADQKSIHAVTEESKTLIEKAKSGKLLPADSEGGTFTLSNLGMYGVTHFTPVINPPECAILGVGAVADRPIAVGGTITVRSIMSLSLTFDHRITDGAVAAQFLRHLKEMLEKPEKVLT